MSSVNKVIIVGRLGQDPEVKQFANGGSIVNVSVATSERWTDKQTGEPKEQTEWHRVVFQNRGNYRMADTAAQYLRKGSMVYVEGSLHTRKWTDQQGIERYTTEINASQLTILSSNNNHPNNQAGNTNYNNNTYQDPMSAGYGAHQPYGNHNQHGGFGQAQAWHDSAPQMQNNFNQQQNAPRFPAQNPDTNHAMSGNQFAGQNTMPKPNAPQGAPKGAQNPEDDDMPF